MSKEPQNIKEIDDYLSGGLTPELRNAFEKKLEGDSNLREDFDATKQLIEGIEGYAFKKMVRELHQKHFGKEK